MKRFRPYICISMMLLLLLVNLTGCDLSNNNSTNTTQNTNDVVIETTNLDNIPAYDGSSAYVIVNNNIPFFDESDFTEESWEYYSDLDELGRCGVTFANLSTETMPAENEERGAIGHVKPSGWHTVKYPEYISDLYLYNRCHLIGWQLGSENANEKNLITGTRYLNIEGMLPFENQVADYIKETNNNVLYRVTPYYTGDNLIADGVLIEAHSVQDEGCVFCVWCYNVQPGISIDYATGESWITENGEPENTVSESSEIEYILNTNSHKIHMPDCSSAQDMKPQNKETYTGDPDDLLNQGYTYCGSCFK